MTFEYRVRLHEHASLGELNSVLEEMRAIGSVVSEDGIITASEIRGRVETDEEATVINVGSFGHGYSLAQKEIEINDFLRSLGWETAETPFKLVKE